MAETIKYTAPSHERTDPGCKEWGREGREGKEAGREGEGGIGLRLGGDTGVVLRMVGCTNKSVLM